MPETPRTVVPLNADQHAQLAITPQRDYRFAATRQVVRISGNEVPKASQTTPVAFMKHGDHFAVTALMGLEADQNLYVDRSSGRWLADYIPADLRAHPFSLHVLDGQTDATVCVAEDDAHLVDLGQGGSADAVRLFDEQGSPTDTLEQMFAFFKAQHASYARTDRQLDLLNSFELIVPWSLRLAVPGRNRTADINGLYRIDEARLNALSPERFQALRELDCLPLIYAHLLSLSLTRRLQQLHLIRAEPDRINVDINRLFVSEDDMLEFNFKT